MRIPDAKIMNAVQARAWREDLRQQGLPLVMTNGCFDLLHRGHVEYLNRARQLGAALLVAVNTDASISLIKGPERPIVPQADRAYLLASLECIDAVLFFGDSEDTSACPLLRALMPDVYVKGGDYTLDTINQSERRVMDELGIRVAFLPLVPGLSTTEIVRRIRRAEAASSAS